MVKLMNYNDNDLRRQYLVTKGDRYQYLEFYRDPPPLLTDFDKRLMWLSARDVVQGAANKHFKKKQSGCPDTTESTEEMDDWELYAYEDMEERVLLLISHIRNTPLTKGMGWAVSTFKSRFGQFDQKNFLEKRSRVGYGFTNGIDKDDEDWDYGTYKGDKKNPARPTLVDSHQYIQRVTNTIFNQYGNNISQKDLLLLLTSMLKKPTRTSMLRLANKLHSYNMVNLMEKAYSYSTLHDTEELCND